MVIDFKSLIKLQNIDEQIKNISNLLEKNPSQIEEIDKKIEDSITTVTTAKLRLAENQKKRRNLEAEVQDTNAQIEKYKRQLNNIKTNIEYKSLLKEIDNSQSKIRKMEEQILEEMLQADELGIKIKEAENEAKEINKKLSEEKEILIKESHKRGEEKQHLTQEKNQITPSIPAKLINLYNTIFKKNIGIVLSPVTDDFCSICQIRIRPQVINELKAQNEIILCENCGRILYWQNSSQK